MALPLPAQDAELVTLARRGQEDAFGALYERYFPGVYDFLTRLLRDRQEAADVAQDTFIKAFERLGHLEKPESFKSWLFTIAHRNGLNRIARSKRAVAVGDFYVSDRESSELGMVDPDRAADPERSAEARAAASMIWEAAAGLDPRTYSVMDLHVRQGLESAEIAEVLGVSKGNAYTMVSRMKKTFSQTLSTYLLVRSGSSDCDELAAIVADASGTGLTPALRKTVDRHAKSCDICKENRKVLFLPIKMFAALAAAPIPAGVQAAIWGSVQTSVVGGAGVAVAAKGSATASADGSTPAAASAGGGPAAWIKSNVGALSAAAVLIALLFVGGASLLNNDDEAPTDVLSAGVTTDTEAPSTEVPTTPTTSEVSTTEPATTQAPTSAVPESTTTSTSTLVPLVVETTTTTSTRPPSTTLAPPTLVVRGDSAVVVEDHALSIAVLENDSGYATGAAPAVATAPANGTARVSGSSIIYAPDADYAGTDGFVYSIRGVNGSTKTGQVTVSVTAVNDAPTVPGPGNLLIEEDSTARFDPLAGAHDVDGDTLEMVSFDDASEHGGSVTSGSLVYAPPLNWSGVDSFNYVITDGSVDVRITVKVSVAAVNDVPTGPDPVLRATEGGTGTGNILEGWSDVEGDFVTVADFGTRVTAKGGTADVSIRGATVYTPRPGFSGIDTFHVSVTDGIDSVAVSVKVIVGESNDPPRVDDSTFAVDEDTAVGDVVGVVSATDPDGDDFVFEPLSQSVVEIRSDGRVVLVEALDFETANRHRLDARVVDDFGATTEFFVFINVADVDEAPVLGNLTFSVSPDGDDGDVLGKVNAVDPEGAAVTYRLRNTGGHVSIGATTGIVTLRHEVDPAAYPLTVTVVSSDPAGNEGRSSLLLVIEDVDGPTISNFAVDTNEFYEPPAGGGVCPARPRSATFTTEAADATGVRGVDLHWRITVNGQEISGVAKMAFIDGRWEVEFTAPPGVLGRGGAQTLYARARARDDFGNTSTSNELGVTVLPCDED
ncbi:MAG: sigma-70 family RNA polymerase sigma factor [bacterium]|nr:sigma-70 family RNA polymerase sigma factor [bacterium]